MQEHLLPLKQWNLLSLTIISFSVNQDRIVHFLLFATGAESKYVFQVTVLAHRIEALAVCKK